MTSELAYPAHFEPAPEGGYVITFRDLPEALTQGDDDDDALLMAEDVLGCVIEWRMDDGRPIPAPSSARTGERLISVPAAVMAKLAVTRTNT